MARIHKHDRNDFSGANPPSMIRQQAIAEGKRFYETGVPCKRGHIAPRYTINHVCVQCNAEKYRRDRAVAVQRDADEARRRETVQHLGEVMRRNAAQGDGGVEDVWWATHERVTWYTGFIDTSRALLAAGRNVWEKP